MVSVRMAHWKDSLIFLPQIRAHTFWLLIPSCNGELTEKSRARHRVRNNLPGTPDFCPLVFRTPMLDEFVAMNLQERARAVVDSVPRDLLARTAAFLLLKDSKSSYVIEGDVPRKIEFSAGGEPSARREGHRLMSKNCYGSNALSLATSGSYASAYAGKGASWANVIAKTTRRSRIMSAPARTTYRHSFREWSLSIAQQQKSWMRWWPLQFWPSASSMFTRSRTGMDESIVTSYTMC